jgi:hypothetical protein
LLMKTTREIVQLSYAWPLPRAGSRHHVIGSNCALVLFSVAATSPLLLWICFDRSVWMWDQSLYGEHAANLLRTLIHEPAEWPAAMLRALGFKPPLLSWVGQFFLPLGILIGKAEAGLLLWNIVVHTATMITVGMTVRSLVPTSVAGPILAAACIAVSPLAVGLAGQYVVEPTQGLLIALIWALAVRARALQARMTLIYGALLAALGMACKTTTPIYALGPALLILGAMSAKRDWRAPVTGYEIRFGLAAALVVTLVTLWYRHNLPQVLQHARNATVGEVALDYGWVATFWSKAETWLVLLQRSTFLPWTALAIALGLAAGLIGFLVRRSPGTRMAALVAAVALAQIAFCLAIFSSQVMVEPRFAQPLVPTLAIAAGLTIGSLGRLTTVAVGALLTFQFAIVHSIALGLLPPRSEVSNWLRPIERRPEDKHALLIAVEKSCASPEDALRYNIVGVQFPSLNENSAAFYASVKSVRSGWTCYYTSLGYGQKDADAAIRRIKEFKTNYFISAPVERLADPNFLNLASEATLERVLASPDFERVETDADSSILVFRHRPTD